MQLNKFSLDSINTTKVIAQSVYKLSKKGDIFALYGDIGVGKTTFVRYFIGFASGLCYIPSPSYNIYFEYKSKKAKIYHMDAWRIDDDTEIFNLGILDFIQDSIFLIEWADKVDSHLPKSKLEIYFEYTGNQRTISFIGNNNWKTRLDKGFERNNIG